MKIFPVFLGMHKKEAFVKIAELRIAWRICRDNNTFFNVCSEYNAERLNLYFINDIVSYYEFR